MGWAGNVAGLVSAIIGLFLSVVLTLVTRSIYNDGEFIDPYWMALHTLMVIAGNVSAITGLTLAWRSDQLTRPTFMIAALLSLLAILPGFAFSWTGFAGFGARFFFLFILTPSVVLHLLYLAAGMLLSRQINRPARRCRPDSSDVLNPG